MTSQAYTARVGALGLESMFTCVSSFNKHDYASQTTPSKYNRLDFCQIQAYVL